MSDFWVFGYGSLMWKPGFAHMETARALLHGYRRALCIHSNVHRGTPEQPGLVLGLDRGGSCLGLAFRVPGELMDEVLVYLRAREMINNVYVEKHLPLRLADGRQVTALAYVADRSHRQYAGALPAIEAAAIVGRASGQSGANTEYVMSTVDHLRKMGIRDHRLENVAALLAGLTSI
ncbi:gamma-glutamylcyclotransferase [Phyllobacterium leguminum]|uniref:glutathione-specific gamma-glutamylcyclotransferase n=1 Tax=Phyllobacterium leguminum TaxID=314237 RepID=A0A318T6P9_9HYPH|nr:gamma-glutamylcyclotransferase [Phyllobacterium leguminum]PYE89022.1 cation transport protein ChaC [Phyllobacterium leguminum]